MKKSLVWLGVTSIGAAISIYGNIQVRRAVAEEQQQARLPYGIVGVRNGSEVRDYGIHNMTDREIAYEDAIKQA